MTFVPEPFVEAASCARAGGACDRAAGERCCAANPRAEYTGACARVASCAGSRRPRSEVDTFRGFEASDGPLPEATFAKPDDCDTPCAD